MYLQTHKTHIIVKYNYIHRSAQNLKKVQVYYYYIICSLVLIKIIKICAESWFGNIYELDTEKTFSNNSVLEKLS